MTQTIGIDHGYGYIKTVHAAFEAGVGVYGTEPPLLTRVVKYNGKYYALGGGRQKVKPKKTTDENYYIMTLGAIAEELKFRSETQASIVIAAGLPLTRFGAEKDEFKKYLLKNETLHFEYERIRYDIKIEDVVLYPQGYSAIVEWISDVDDVCTLVDIGSWTVDIMPMFKKRPDMKQCKSLNGGVITCMNSINEECRRVLGEEVDEHQIQKIMLDEKCSIPEKYRNIIQAGVKSFANELMESLREQGVKIDSTSTFFVGGGACIVKNFLPSMDCVTILNDIHANAKGYELLCKSRR